MIKNVYSKEFEDTMYKIGQTRTLKELVGIAIKQFNYKIKKSQLRQYLSKRNIQYKDYDLTKIRDMGKRYPIGSEYVKPDGMTLIKIAKNKWEYKQRYIYENYYKVKLTSSDYIIFLDGNRNNFDINNLKRVSNIEAGILGNKIRNNKINNINIEKETNKDMFNYKVKQTNAKLENWYICKELEIKYNTWQDIKKGRRSLARKKLDRFLELTDTTKQVWLEQESEKKKIDAWFKENKANISEIINDFGVNNVMIAADLGVDNSTISNIRNGKGDTLQAVYLLYYYLNDDNNRRHTKARTAGRKPGKEPGRKPAIQPVIKVETQPVIKVQQEINEKTPEEIANEIVNHEPDNRDILIDKLENQVEGLKFENDRLSEELARYKYLIDLARQRC